MKDKDLYKLIEDVIKDFRISISVKDMSKNFLSFLTDENILKDIIYSRVSDIKELDTVDDTYAIVNYILYMVYDKENIEGEIERIFREPIDNIIERLEIYKWIPKELEEIRKGSNNLYEMAESMYYFYKEHEGKELSSEEISYVDEQRKKAKTKLNKIENLGVALERLNYKYRAKSDIMTEYEEILSESTLDCDTINGETFTVSLRLGHEIMQVSDNEIEDSIEEGSDEIGTVEGLESFGIIEDRGSNLETDTEYPFKNFKDNPFKVEKLNNNTESIFKRAKNKIRKVLDKK